MLRPPRLRPGDRVAVVAPSSPFDRERFDRGMIRLAERYELAPHSSLFERQRYLAGSDDVRAAALLDAFSDPGNRAVVCARGGSGASRLLPRIDFGRLPLKPLIGFSDSVVLHAALQAICIATPSTASCAAGAVRGSPPSPPAVPFPIPPTTTWCWSRRHR